MGKVLLIDDSWLTRRGLSNILAAAGHSVIEAEGGVDGIKAALEKQPDCIFLDLLMPDMDGFSVLQRLNENESRIPVVVFSADIQDTSRRKCLEMGAFDFLNKPPNENEILETLHRALKCS